MAVAFPGFSDKDDSWGLLGDYAAIYAWFLGLQLLDFMSTLAVLHLGGQEANPLASAAIDLHGISATLVIKVALVLLTLAVWLPAASWLSHRPAATRRWAVPIMSTLVMGAALVYTVVVFHNLVNLAILARST